MNVEKRKVDELKFYPGNPRTMSEDQIHGILEIDPHYCDVIIDR